MLMLAILMASCVTTSPANSKSQIGNLEINVRTEDENSESHYADIYIDGHYFGTSSVNKPILYLKEGQHVIKVQLKGYQVYEKQMSIFGEPNHQVLNVKLKKLAL